MAHDVTWLTIDNSNDLRILNQKVIPDDSEAIEIYASSINEAFFPGDISRSGYNYLNWRILLRASTPGIEFVEAVFIACERLEWYWFQNPHFEGRIDTLRRVELYGPHKATAVSCARLIYRTHSELRKVASTNGIYLSRNSHVFQLLAQLGA
jgi:hypothetical protein